MKRALGLVCVLALAGLAQSCVNDNSAVYISGVIDPDDECISAPDGDPINVGVYDPGSLRGYAMSLRVESQLINRQTDIAADPSAVRITDADIELRAVDGTPLDLGGPNPYRIPAQGYIASSDDGSPAVSAIAIAAIPASIAVNLGSVPGGMFVVRIQLRGVTNGSLDIDTPAFEFPVEIANQCDPTGTFDSCRPGQDGHNRCGT